MRKLRIGIIGLGSIAQKAYLPILTKEIDWEFVGAFSPNIQKRNDICKQYRIQPFSSLRELANTCDALFVHSSTNTHFEIVSELIKLGKDVYVDKPLAETIVEAERLVELSDKYKRRIMVGFNRRFAPMYKQIKNEAVNVASIRMEKHRCNSVGPYDYTFTMFDDYLHLVDTVRWLNDDDLFVADGMVNVTDKDELCHALHLFKTKQNIPSIVEMHRRAGTNLERIEIVSEGAVYRVKNLQTLEIERGNGVISLASGSWESIVKQRGFQDAVTHFIHSVQYDDKLLVDALEGYKSQLLVEQLIKQAKQK